MVLNIKREDFMNIPIYMKTPDCLDNALSQIELTDKEIPGLSLMDQEESYYAIKDWIVNIKKEISKYFAYGEMIILNYDTEKKKLEI